MALEIELGINDYFRILQRRKWVVIASVIMVSIGGFIFARLLSRES